MITPTTYLNFCHASDELLNPFEGDDAAEEIEKEVEKIEEEEEKE